MKKVTFPHMGNLYLPAKTFFETMGLEVIVPPANSKKTLDLGMKYSPEFACLPLKINIGNFIESLEKGAEVIVMGGGRGPCRFGYYGQVQQEIIHELGYDFELISLEPEIWKTFKKVRHLFGGISIKKIYKAGKLAWLKMQVMDNIHSLVLEARAREKKDGIVDKLYQKFLTKLDTTMSVDKINQLGQQYKEKIMQTRGPYKRGIQIKVGIVGEIYVVMEPFVNIDLEKKLGELGVTVSREMYLTNWIRDFLNIGHERHKITTAAAPYLESFVGGHGQDSVGHTVKYAEEGFDGVIQVAPFTCMPEIVAQSILPETGKKENIHILTIIFDEHSADAGLKTRLEAFIDLLHRQKQELGGNVKVK